MIVHDKKVAIWDGQFTKPLRQQFSISFCTTCMGRLHDLRQTLAQNIADNADYPAVEFVLLDYHSQDGLETWVKESMRPHIESGRLVYARTTEPQAYEMAHSRNVAFKLASGDIVCNLDADNWTGPGFASALNRVANEQPERAVFTKSRQRLRGRVAMYKQEWEELLGGYDEDFRNYGHDDRDLVNRALLQGFKLMCFGGQYVSRIKTSGPEKVAHMKSKDWRKSEVANQLLSAEKIERGQLRCNVGRRWGVANVRKNFTEDLAL